MIKEKRKKDPMTKDKVPQDFTLSLALVDAIPVLFFGATMITIGTIFNSKIFLLGAILCFWAGAAKVLWKIIVVLGKKNIWWMFLQMRIVMPVGFLLMLASIPINSDKVSISGIIGAVTTFPSCLFFLAGFIGMILMGVFAAKLDNSDLGANWIEQLTNGAAQIAFFIGVLLLK